jgi:hypothetical protein
MILLGSSIMRINITTHSNNFFNLAVMAIVLPHQEVRNPSRIFDAASDKPCRNHRHVLAIEPGAETQEILVASSPLFPLIHRLIPVAVLSSKIPLRGCIFKESVKVCTPKLPSSTDNTPLYRSLLNIVPQGASA